MSWVEKNRKITNRGTIIRDSRVDRNKNGDGIMIFIRDTNSIKTLEIHNFPKGVEGIYLELTFRKYKWLLCGTYHPPSQSHECFQ